MPNAAKAVRQDMRQKAAHELVGIERLEVMAFRAAATVNPVVEGLTFDVCGGGKKSVTRSSFKPRHDAFEQTILPMRIKEHPLTARIQL